MSVTNLGQLSTAHHSTAHDAHAQTEQQGRAGLRESSPPIHTIVLYASLGENIPIPCLQGKAETNSIVRQGNSPRNKPGEDKSVNKVPFLLCSVFYAVQNIKFNTSRFSLSESGDHFSVSVKGLCIVHMQSIPSPLPV